MTTKITGWRGNKGMNFKELAHEIISELKGIRKAFKLKDFISIKNIHGRSESKILTKKIESVCQEIVRTLETNCIFLETFMH